MSSQDSEVKTGGDTPQTFLEAILANNVPRLKEILSQDPQIIAKKNPGTGNWSMPLFVAIDNSNFETVDFLLKQPHANVLEAGVLRHYSGASQRGLKPLPQYWHRALLRADKKDIEGYSVAMRVLEEINKKKSDISENDLESITVLKRKLEFLTAVKNSDYKKVDEILNQGYVSLNKQRIWNDRIQPDPIYGILFNQLMQQGDVNSLKTANRLLIATKEIDRSDYIQFEDDPGFLFSEKQAEILARIEGLEIKEKQEREKLKDPDSVGPSSESASSEETRKKPKP